MSTTRLSAVHPAFYSHSANPAHSIDDFLEGAQKTIVLLWSPDVHSQAVEQKRSLAELPHEDSTLLQRFEYAACLFDTEQEKVCVGWKNLDAFELLKLVADPRTLGDDLLVTIVEK